MQTQNYKYIYTCMHVCTHICIITYICCSGFPAKLLSCVVHYPRAPSRKAEIPPLGAGDFEASFSWTRNPQSYSVHRPRCPLAQAQASSAAQSPSKPTGTFLSPLRFLSRCQFLLG